MEEEKKRVVAMIRTWKHEPYQGVNVAFAVDRGYELEADRYCTWLGFPLKDFMITSQGGGYTRGTAENKRLYALTFSYKGDIESLCTINEIKPIFSKVERALEKHRDDFGYNMDFPTYCMIIIRALGIDSAVYNGREYTNIRYALEDAQNTVLAQL
jgi:hypothetical protein